MVYKHNKMPCDHENSFQVVFQHMRQLDCGDQFGSSGHMHIPEKQRVPDGSKLGGKLEFGKMGDVAPNHISGCAHDNTTNFSLVMISNGDTTSENNFKRPFGYDENFQVAVKRTRQMDGNFPPTSSTCEGSFAASDEEFNSRKYDVIHRSAYDSYGSSFSFQWFTCEDTPLESPVRLSFYPGYYEECRRPARHNRGQECPSTVFNRLPRKTVAIGPYHQADIPMCMSKNFPGCHQGHGINAAASGGHVLTNEDDCEKWTQRCVIPMPDSGHLEEPIGCFKSDCHCVDEGSIRCVRQHVMEARDELMMSLGHERFVELGFHDMGEDVALGWTEEEERLFNDVVVYNPASSGKNFWGDLPLAFPSRSGKELVSYYFNVFMLRKRGDQNRHDPSNADSDDDEWQYGDDGEFGATEDDDDNDDSGVESPADTALEDNRVHRDIEVDIHEEADEDYCDSEDHGVSDRFPGSSKSKFDPGLQSTGLSIHGHAGVDHDLHDVSCASYEGKHDGIDTSGVCMDVLDGLRECLGEEAVHGKLHLDYSNAGMSGIATDHDLIIGHCDLKPWEMGSFCGLDKDMEFLPTCNVIEEVFGNESWEKSREDHGVS